MAAGWSSVEVEATVADYFAMLNAELRGEAYSKTEHRRRLQRLLDKRTDAAIELKHQNISAILTDICGLPYIKGYLPRRNYQQLLAEVVLGHLEANPGIVGTVRMTVEAPVEVPEVDDILRALVDPPKPANKAKGARGRQRAGRHYDFLEREAATRERGKDGELFALRFEQARLISLGLERLAARIEHVSVEQGDGLGFDILSYEKNTAERFIEVKATRYGALVPFFFTRNEREFSLENRDRFHLYRVFDLGSDPHLFIKSCPLDAPHFDIEATEYQARVA
jgi:hypothetical protein